MSATTRTEHDFLGDVEVPATAYWGVHTARALENFDVTGFSVGRHRGLVAALGAVKQAAARVNRRLGLLDAEVAEAIEHACTDVRAGDLDDEFVVDAVQGGAGTSTNMNTNEVVANRALELLGLPRGRYDVVSPNDHVNRSQSTNDVYPTAVRLALIDALGTLDGVVARLVTSLAEKAAEHADVVKVGRTQLQDAVPMTVGQELRGWSVTLREERARIADARALLCEVNLGATAIGTGITTAPGYADAVVVELADLTALPLVGAGDLVEATSDTGAFVQVSATLKRTAVKASKICNDLRLLSSGPQAGFGELRLPPRQAGSSIMPGKVNPVIPELVNQVAFAVAGNDVAVTMAAEGGQLQLNPFEPLIAHLLLQGADWLTRALDTLTTLCIRGLDVDRERLSALSARSVGVVTALTPHIGYAAAAELARAALAGDGDVRALVGESGLVPLDRLDALLLPAALTEVAGPRPVVEDGPMIVGLFQLQPVSADPEANLARIARAARSAADYGADVLVCPEMSLTGYNLGLEVERIAEDRDGPLVRRLSALAAETGVHLVAGFPERVDDAVYNTAVLARPEGGCELYRKCHLYGPDERAAFTASEEPPHVFDLAGLKAGMVICYDVEFPEMVQRLARGGADLVLVPTALARTPSSQRIAQTVVPSRAFENHVFIVYADLCGTERGLDYQGSSAIVAPDGADLARAGATETLLLAELNVGGYEAERAETPYGDDRRPELYARFDS